MSQIGKATWVVLKKVFKTVYENKQIQFSLAKNLKPTHVFPAIAVQTLPYYQQAYLLNAYTSKAPQIPPKPQYRPRLWD
jgi:hypothetical protein